MITIIITPAKRSLLFIRTTNYVQAIQKTDITESVSLDAFHENDECAQKGVIPRLRSVEFYAHVSLEDGEIQLRH